MKTETKKMQRW